MFRKTKPRHPCNQQRGVAAVEFAMIAPVMMLFTFGLIEMGRFMLVKEAATHATREGARTAVRPFATNEEVVQRVNEELAIMAIQGATITIDPLELEDAEPGSMVTVRVQVSPDSISWVPGIINIEAANIIAESTMRRESTN
jgi:Flp pilus assembly protein TadG